MLRIFARFLAVVFSIAFVVVTIPVVFFHAAGTRLTQPQVYKDALAKERFYDRFPSLAAGVAANAIKYDARVRSPDVVFQDRVAHNWSVTDWETAFGTVLSPSYVRQQTERSLDQFFAWVNSNTALPVVNVDLREFKRRLVAPEIEEAYVGILQTKPACTASELEADAPFPVACCPPAEEMPRVRQAFRATMQNLANEVPETVDLIEMLNGSGEADAAISKLPEVRTRLVQLETLAWWSPAAPAALLLLIAVFAVRSFRGWMWWWGIPCMIAGAAGVVLALSAVPVARWMNACFISPNLPAASVPAATGDVLAAVVTAVVQSVMDAAFQSACILALGGLFAVVLGAVLKPRPKPADGASGK
jgi:hypothetical protein